MGVLDIVDALVDFFIHSFRRFMAISKQKKVDILSTLDAGIKDAETVVFVNFHKLPGKDMTQLRKELRESGVTYFVAKKTLVRRVLDAKKVTGTQPAFDGELALAWSKDPIAPAKGVFEFAKTHKEQVSLMGGVYQGAYMSKEEITELASIPGREVLLGQFVGMLNESITRVVRAMSERAKQMEGGAPVVATEAAPELAAA
ncbi:MAG: 50S ribosomal protein L10 [Parcubacteria group bacterium GW2011_GWA2_47_7]|nr:MAG: 50S ribosomal protein L10 [Parcubacteria group bacterium GW2011_GWA2_47_7]HCM67670.1 50S ribosomal protein L10 [Candidatus Kerfeldbacteria bacterium]